jgi:hypothetical protein
MELYELVIRVEAVTIVAGASAWVTGAARSAIVHTFTRAIAGRADVVSWVRVFIVVQYVLCSSVVILWCRVN